MTQTRTERFETRLTSEQKKQLTKAASLQGVSLSEFIVNSAQKAANQILLEEDLLSLTLRDRLAFIDALTDDSPPDSKLQKAADNYKNKMSIA